MSELETVWSGNSWRTFPPPVVAKPVIRRVHAESSMDRLWAVMTDGLQSRRCIQDRAGMAPARVTEYLHRLVAQGRVEHEVIGGGKGRRGRGQHFYRRKQA